MGRQGKRYLLQSKKSMKIRNKRKDVKMEFVMYVDYGQGFEYELTEDSVEEIEQRKKEYREDCPQYPIKIIMRKKEV